jgi:hypothetical protein
MSRRCGKPAMSTLADKLRPLSGSSLAFLLAVVSKRP